MNPTAMNGISETGYGFGLFLSWINIFPGGKNLYFGWVKPRR